MNEIMRVALDAATTAGCFLGERFGTAPVVTVKSDASLVTGFDCEAERIITDKIRAAFPGHGIIGEEGGPQRIRDAEYVWIVDPLDGTHNYIRGIPLFGVSIGVARHGSLVAGVIYMPVEKNLYTAHTGSGAYKNGARIRVSSCDTLSRASIVCDSGIRNDPERVAGACRDLGAKAFNVRMFGTSVCTFTFLAEGKVEAGVEFGDSVWDFAGGVCIAREAGARVSTFDGNDMTLDDRAYVASNGLVHDAILDIVGTPR